MSFVPESRTPHFGLRDFLQYLIPGVIILMSVALFANITLEMVKDFSGIGTSIFMVLFAYFIGQVAYSATYPLRYLLRDRTRLSEKPDKFKEDYMWVIEKHTTYYTAEIYRYRTFARFSVAMILPTMVLGIAFCIRLWPQSKIGAIIISFITIVSVVAFAFRYLRYDLEFRNQVFKCKNYEWKENN